VLGRGGLSVHVGIVAISSVRVVVEDLDRFDFLQQELINYLDIRGGQCAGLRPRGKRRYSGEDCNEDPLNLLRFITGPPVRPVRQLQPPRQANVAQKLPVGIGTPYHCARSGDNACGAGA
jgi:hypothetical protein